MGFSEARKGFEPRRAPDNNHLAAANTVGDGA
jgi:hypothetical protein